MNDYIDIKNQQLIQNITEQIDSINNFVAWCKANLGPGRKEEAFKSLVNKRRRLKMLKFSLENKPAVAAFGESQKGKSYVISSLLALRGKQFMVTDPKTGDIYDFVEQLNPMVRDVEATGVVTRFTKSYNVVDDAFPIMVRILSIADILQVLCDTAYNDVKSHPVIEHEDIDEFMQQQERRFSDGAVAQNAIDEDDIMNIREYVVNHIGDTKAKELLDSSFFDVMSRIMPGVPVREWPLFFSKLWYDNPDITTLFESLLKGYEALNFSPYVYIPIKALNNKTMTLMSTLCLQQLDKDDPLLGNTDPSIGTDLITSNRQHITGFSKSVLSAITSEVMFQIPDETIKEELVYHFEGIEDAETKRLLQSKGWNKQVKKEFLNDTDIFDFPGARTRLEIEEKDIPDLLRQQMLLRGKVAYLFNKYSDERLLNILMLCHDNVQNATSVMPGLLEQWVNQNVGSSVTDRTAFVDKSVVSPLFFIATKFNKDMSHSVQGGGDDSLEDRWRDRYNKVYYEQIIQGKNKPWFDNWTSRGSFKNTYLLRDFKYSSDNGDRLFAGFLQKGVETSENDPSFHEKIRKSFVADSNVKRFFEDPELSWYAAATMNNDGATRIIENLSIAASNVKESRVFRFQNEISLLHADTLALMQDFYHDESEADMLKKSISRCGSIVAEMDVVCGNDNYFFGRALHKLQISEHQVFDFFYKELNSPHNISQQDVKEYVLILNRCRGMLSAEKTFNDNLKVLCQTYHISDPMECQSFFENKKNVDLNRLFSCDFRQKSNSEILASGIVDKWLEDMKSPQCLKFFENSRFSTMILLDLIDNICSVAVAMKLKSKIAHHISPFVDAVSVPPQILDMVADTTAEMLNCFVIDFGYGYIKNDKEKIDELKEISAAHSLGLSFSYGYNPVPSSLEELSELFDAIRPTEENDTTTLLPSFVNYNKWIEYLTISFISSCHVPTYDVEANSRLGLLLTKYREIQ